MGATGSVRCFSRRCCVAAELLSPWVYSSRRAFFMAGLVAVPSAFFHSTTRALSRALSVTVAQHHLSHSVCMEDGAVARGRSNEPTKRPLSSWRMLITHCTLGH